MTHSEIQIPNESLSQITKKESFFYYYRINVDFLIPLDFGFGIFRT